MDVVNNEEFWKKMLSRDMEDIPNSAKFLTKLRKMAAANLDEAAGTDPGQLAFDAAKHVQILLAQLEATVNIALRGGFIRDSDGMLCKAHDIVRNESGDSVKDCIEEIVYDDESQSLRFRKVNGKGNLSAVPKRFTLLATSAPTWIGKAVAAMIKEA